MIYNNSIIKNIKTLFVKKIILLRVVLKIKRSPMNFDISLPLLLLSILIGYLLGVFSGLVPGIHTNNFALMLVALSPVIMQYGISPIYVIVIILSNSLSHTFHDVIPAVYLGAPNDDTALAVLPGHRLLLDGFGSEAVRLSALGSAGSVAFSLILVLPLVFLFTHIYSFLQEYLGWFLLGLSVLLILSEKGEYTIGQGSLVRYRYRFYALLLFLLSGILGLFAFRTEANMAPIIDFGSPSILLPLLSGLFGASQLVISLSSSSVIPPQRYSKIELSYKRIIRGVVTGSAAGSIVAWLPGISSSIAAVLARMFIRDDFEDPKTHVFPSEKKNTKNLFKNSDAVVASSHHSVSDQQSDDLRSLILESETISPSLSETTEPYFSGRDSPFEDIFDRPDLDTIEADDGDKIDVLFGEDSVLDKKGMDDAMDASREFIVSVSGVNTSNAIFGLFALAVIGKTRSGAMVAINEIMDTSLDNHTILLFLLVIVSTALLSYLSTIAIGNRIHHILSRIDYSVICISVITGLVLMSFLFTGWYGLLIFIIATPLGMFAPFMKIRRSHAMGVILLPVILYFI